jgi:hypothetical protein
VADLRQAAQDFAGDNSLTVLDCAVYGVAHRTAMRNITPYLQQPLAAV